MGEKQPPAEQDRDPVTAQPPEVIDLRGNGSAAPRDTAAANGSRDTAPAVETARPASGRLTANEWWHWESLVRQISDLQRDTRRITGRVVVSQRSHVASIAAAPAPAVKPAPEVVAELAVAELAVAEPEVVEPEVVESEVAEPEVAEPEGVEAPEIEQTEPELAEPQVDASPEIEQTEPELVESQLVEPEVPESEVVEPEVVEPEVVEPQVDTAPEIAQIEPEHSVEAVVAQEPPGVTRSGPDQRFWGAGTRALVVTSVAVVLVMVAAVVVVAVALLVRDNSPAQRATARASASGASPSPELAPGAVRWLERNTAPGTRVFVPARLVDDLAAGLRGRAVLAYGETTAGPGDLVVVGQDFADLPAGSLTQQVVADARVVGKLPGSDIEVRQVIALEDSGVEARRAAGSELVANPALSFNDGSMAALRNGRVDERVLVILAGLGSEHSLAVRLPRDPADAPEAPLRTLQIRGWDGAPVTASAAREIDDFVTAQLGFLAAPVVAHIDVSGLPAVSVRYRLPASVDLLSSGSFPTTSEESP